MKTMSLLISVILLVTIASAQTKERVKFARGASAATVKGTVRGFAYHDYLVRASDGQTIDLRLTANGSPSVFTVFLPSEDNLEGASEMNDFSGDLPVSGDYVIRVLMMRSEARRKGSVSNYKLKISIR